MSKENCCIHCGKSKADHGSFWKAGIGHKPVSLNDIITEIKTEAKSNKSLGEHHRRYYALQKWT